MLIKTEIIGNLVRDAVVRDAGDRQVLSFTIAATAASWTDKDGNRQTKTEYADCSVWGNPGSFDKLMELNMMAKGHMVRVEATPDTSGAPQHSEKTGQYYNNIKYSVERRFLNFLNTPHKVGGSQAPQQQQQAAPQQQQAAPQYQQQQAAPQYQQQQAAPQQQQQQAAPQQHQQQAAPQQQQQAQFNPNQGQGGFEPPVLGDDEDIPF